jgi:hypothetical protein
MRSRWLGQPRIVHGLPTSGSPSEGFLVTVLVKVDDRIVLVEVVGRVGV